VRRQVHEGGLFPCPITSWQTGGGKIPSKKSPFLWFISLGEQRNEQKRNS
jgi:hypothetical protein